jgi:SpoVK/Ycf46/Vps4 family AAA+-type ATPase
MRFFNTAGPVQPANNYCIPPLERFDLDDVLGLIRTWKYFVLHAPRQTGKTSSLLALRDLLNSGAVGEYRCVYANVEGAQAAREDTRRAMQAILNELASRARLAFQDEFVAQTRRAVLETAGPDAALAEVLSLWAQADPRRPLVLFIDEIDALIGDTLVSVLRQLRAGYDQRPDAFPQSVVLCGLRDVRDYRIHASSENEIITGGSAFNVRSESLRLGDFTRREVLFLLAQHTEETGQTFTPEACERVWTQTRGQPWLVNALAYESCFRNKGGRNRDRPITRDDIDDAQEALILRRETHLDQLTDKLQEDRVRRVIEPVLSGIEEPAFSARDLEYVRDLGLIAQDDPVRLANPIYGEVVPRELTYAVQAGLVQETAWYVTPDGGLDVVKLLAAFQTFFREHSEHWSRRFTFQEAWPQLLLQAFLQRVVNGGGRVEREHGLGRLRADLVILWPQHGHKRKVVVELKIRRGELEKTIHDGLEQTAACMDRCAAESGHLVIVDPGDGKWEDKTFHRVAAHAGAEIHVWGM